MDRAILDDELSQIFDFSDAPELIVLAVSGGGDSMAMMHLFARYRHLCGDGSALSASQVIVACVDHGLREGSGEEAQFVAQQAVKLGFEYEILPWVGEKPTSGLQQAAREERYGLLFSLCERRGLPAAIMVAHHLDDQAETLLMRLARGSGLVGLTGMKREDSSRLWGEVTIWRPFLHIEKARLLASLRRDGVWWLNDPSNENEDFERVRIRNAHKERATLGLSDKAVARSARRLLRANAALDEISARAFEQNVSRLGGAYCEIPVGFVLSAPEEIILRVVSKTISFVTSCKSPPNLSKLENVVTALTLAARSGVLPSIWTLGGCVIVLDGADGRCREGGGESSPTISFFYEPGRAELSQAVLMPGQGRVWGDRFHCSLSSEATTSLTIKALDGEILSDLRKEADVSSWRPVRALKTLPSFWDGDRLIFVPHLDYCVCGWSEPLPDIEHIAVI